MRFAGTDSLEPITQEPAPVVDLRRMTRAELRQLGLPRLVYLRCGTVDGQPAFAIHAADGTAMAVVEDVEVAIELASANDMTFVAVH
jgi:hypothetical protein